MEAAHFPKEPVHTGLNILDRLPKKKKNTLKATKLTSYRNFRMIQAMIKSIERSTVERIEEKFERLVTLFIYTIMQINTHNTAMAK